MNLKVVFTNELPFMLNLNSGIYKVKASFGGIDKILDLKLSDKTFRLHTSPFPNLDFCNYFDGEAEELENLVVRNKFSNYAFEPLKSYISCEVEENIALSQQIIDSVNKNNLIERIKTLLIQKNINTHFDPPILQELAQKEYGNLNDEGIKKLKIDYIINESMNKLSLEGITFYHIALNNFIKQYSYVRKDHLVEQLTVHTLEGTYCTEYIEGIYQKSIKHASNISTIMTHQRWMQDLEQNEINDLNNRLINNTDIPSTQSLILVARNLIERGEFRSAVIESSAALEIAVEEKITEKMRSKGKSVKEIMRELKTTELDFPRRCDSQLKIYTGYSFVKDNKTLWNIVKRHRNKYRHKIVHSSLVPDAMKAKQIVDDFEKAIKYVQSL